jgi:RNA-binding protein
MISSKQRSFLRGLAQTTDATVFIGKQGLTDNVINEIEVGLNTRELVKVKIQEGCLLDPKETANEMAEKLGAEFVQAIGRKYTLYRESKDNKQIELPRK